MSEFIDRLVDTVCQVNCEKEYRGMIMARGDGHWGIDPALAQHLIRVVLSAMEQPSQKMIKAGEDVRAYDGVEEMDSYGPPEEVWRAMITAELKPD